MIFFYNFSPSKTYSNPFVVILLCAPPLSMYPWS